MRVIISQLFLLIALFAVAHGDEEGSKGVGPVKDVEIGAKVDPKLAAHGKDLFTAKCTPCHLIEKRYVGPALLGVTKRRRPEWIMNMILNPQVMTQEDPTAKELLSQFLVQMTFQNVTQDEARAVLEYFRQNDAKQPAAGPAVTAPTRKKLPGT